MVEMHSIGAGGGSIAHVEAGALRVGPESAGADPGPICYGRGGTRPTVTDANVVLGYINPESLCGGEFKLTTDGVREAVREQVGVPLGLDEVEAAYGIFRIVNANMANAIRRVSSEAGLDPREFCMVVYGGNGPVHAAMQAEELGIRQLLVPKTSPAFSALGLLIADYTVDTQRSYITPSARAEASRVNELLQEMEDAAERELSAAGLSRENLVFQRYLNLCYPGQTFDMAVPMVAPGGRMTDESLKATVEAFHDLHEELHTYAVREEEPVLRAVRVQTVGQTDKPALREYEPVSTSVDDALHSRRSVWFRDRFMDTPVYDGDRLGFGHRLEGPGIVEERFTTIVIYPGHTAEVDRHGNYRIERNDT
jgi:N-methylhydantoinase A